MALSFLYLTACRLVGMPLGRLRSVHANDVELAVLRHQPDVPCRQVTDPSFDPPAVRSWRCCREQRGSPRALVGLPGDARHDPAVVSPAGHAHMGAASASRRPPSARRARGRADPAAGPGAPRWATSASRRAQEARAPRGIHHHPHGAAAQWAPARAPTGVRHVASVPSSAGYRHRGHRLLHRGDRVPQDALRLVLHRAARPAGSTRRLHGPSRRAVGGPAGTGVLDGGGAGRGRRRASVPCS